MFVFSNKSIKEHLRQVLIGFLCALSLEVIAASFIGHYHSHLLERFAWAGEAITGVVAVSALIGFLYQVKHDENLAAADLIGF